MKDKGFVLVETLVASTVILGALVFLFIQFKTIKNAYETSFTYNTIPGLYNAKVLSSFLENYGYTNIENELNSNTKGYVLINTENCNIYYDSKVSIEMCEKILKQINAKRVLYVNSITNLQSKISQLKADAVENSDIFDNDFTKFINQLVDDGHKKIIIKFKNDTYAVVNVGEDLSKEE